MARLKKDQTFIFTRGFTNSPISGDAFPKMEGHGISGWQNGNVFKEHNAAMKLLFKIADEEIDSYDIIKKVQEFTKNKCRPF